MRHLLPNALELAVENKELRSKLSEFLGNLSRDGTSGITVQEGTKPRVLCFVGLVPVGTDKHVRGLLNPDGNKTFKVSTVRNIDLQADIWKTATEEEPFASRFQKADPAAKSEPKAKKGKGKKADPTPAEIKTEQPVAQ